jgi:hypothetical protein
MPEDLKFSKTENKFPVLLPGLGRFDNNDEKAAQWISSDVDPHVWQLYIQAAPGTVRISLTSDFGRKTHGFGSGFIADDKGSVITNWHVVEQSSKDKLSVSIETADGKVHAAKIKDIDPINDLAVLQLPTARYNKQALRLGDANNLREGDHLLALSHPLGTPHLVASPGSFRGKLTELQCAQANVLRENPGRRGVELATALEMRCLDNVGFDYREDARSTLHRVMVAARLLAQSGSSGAPVVNMDGSVIGVMDLAGTDRSFTSLVPNGKVAELLGRKQPQFNFQYNYELAEDSFGNFLLRHSALSALGIGTTSSAVVSASRFAPKSVFGSLAATGVAVGIRDFVNFQDAQDGRLQLKYGTALGCDIGIVAGSAMRLLSRNPRTRLAGALLAGTGALSRISTELIPTYPIFAGVSRTDRTDTRPPFSQLSMDE